MFLRSYFKIILIFYSSTFTDSLLLYIGIGTQNIFSHEDFTKLVIIQNFKQTNLQIKVFDLIKPIRPNEVVTIKTLVRKLLGTEAATGGVPVNIGKYLRTPILRNICEPLFLLVKE